MSLDGNLEHLPIVDVIQLLHSTRKSGTLCVKARKTEAQLVFVDGFIASANHADNDVRVGDILVSMNSITPSDLEQALAAQKAAGASRKPVVATLIERGKIDKAMALKGLETLVQLTVVEMVSWKKGTFSFDVDAIDIAAEYRYFPENLHQEICLDAQMVLMDALRIYDEKVRDGEIVEDEDEDGEEGHIELSAADLGLDDLDQMERKIPDVFSSLESFDPRDLHRQKVQQTLAGCSEDDQEAFVSFLMQAGAGEDGARREGAARALVLYSQDEFTVHCIMTICKAQGILVFSARLESDLSGIIAQSLTKGVAPLVVFDSPGLEPGPFSGESVAQLRRQVREQFPQLPLLQFATATDFAFSQQAYAGGVRAVLPKPSPQGREATFVADTIQFIDTFQAYAAACFESSCDVLVGALRARMAGLRQLTDGQGISFALLQFASEWFERALTLVVGQSGLIAERGIGLRGDKREGATGTLKFKIPLGEPSLFRTAVETGQVHWGPAEDRVLNDHLFSEIGSPQGDRVLLLPLKCRGKVVALTYADLGDKVATEVPLGILEVFAEQAGLVLENALYRKQLEKKTA